jgi:hypothetical protein
MEELIEKIDEEITSSCNVSHKESRLNSDGDLSTRYILHGSALSCLIVNQHPIESHITATVFVKNDQQRVKNALIAVRETPEDTQSHILYRFRIQQNEDNTFRVFKFDDTEYKVNSVKEVVNTVVRRLTMEIETHIKETNE